MDTSDVDGVGVDGVEKKNEKTMKKESKARIKITIKAIYLFIYFKKKCRS